MKIGVFDSGIGGEKIAELIRAKYPKADVISVSDTDNLPYGNKTVEQLRHLVIPKLVAMQQQGCDVLVIACNTVTTVLIKDVRAALHIPIIGFEPMIKPAASLTKTGIIAVCATPATLTSERYKELKNEYAGNLIVIEPDCSDWARLIENNAITHSHIEKVADEALAANADVIVLGCTHYHWIEDAITVVAAGKAKVLQPEKAVMRHLAKLLQKLQ